MDSEARGHLLIIDDDPHILSALSRFLGRVGYRVSSADRAELGLELMVNHTFDAAMVDLHLPGMRGIEFLKRVKEMNLRTEVIIMTGLPSIQIAVEAVRAGAYDFIEKPLPDPEKVQILIDRAVAHGRLHREYESLRQQIEQKPQFDDFVGRSSPMVALISEVKNFAWSSAPVLVLGETGTGKELVAQALHRHSPRKSRPFQAISCPTLKDTLFESELFGHVRGAFTEAYTNKKGVIEATNGGTLFLDEIGDISLPNQAKLLRFLSSGEYTRLGEEAVVRNADVRIIAATNVDLRKAVEQGLFRADLYQRLKVLSINLPPLRDRMDDVPALALYFLRTLAEAESSPVREISAEAMDLLCSYAWRGGNVRELRNTIWEAMTRARGGQSIRPEHLPSDLKSLSSPAPANRQEGSPYSLELAKKPYKRAKKIAEYDFARFYFGVVLDRCQGVVNRAARESGIDPPNLRKKLKEISFDLSPYRGADQGGD